MQQHEYEGRCITTKVFRDGGNRVWSYQVDSGAVMQGPRRNDSTDAEMHEEALAAGKAAADRLRKFRK